MALSTQPYKGARDFYPEDKRTQSYMFDVWRTVCERFGYEQYDAPILESLDLYLAKTGEEIVNEQTYTFEDRGARQVVIRPEMTPSVSRMVAARRQELSYPVRWFSIPNLWRYERPQRGRLREHWQLNVDIFGVASTAAELELIQLVDAMFKEFKAVRDSYEIRLNHRQLIDYLLADYLGLSDDEKQRVAKLIDRMHKLERTKFIAAVDETLTAAKREAGTVEKLLGVLDAQKLSDLPPEAQTQPAAIELIELLKRLEKLGISNVRFDSTLMRGFDYYTGIVFEVFDTDPENNRSMMGGGRYDGLVGLFGVAPVPTVGFGWGDVTLENFLRSHRLLPDLPPSVEMRVLLAGDLLDKAQALIGQLRDHFRLAVDLSGRKLGDQLKAASKASVAYVAIIGEQELKDGVVSFKDLRSGKEYRCLPSEFSQALKADAGD